MTTPADNTPIQAMEGYWAESARPLTSLAFIAPWLIVYEVGVLWFKVEPNGADVFMHWLLHKYVGFSHYVLPLLLVGMLLGWQFLTHSRWRIRPGVLPAMLVESVLLAFCVFGIHYVLGSLLPSSISAFGEKSIAEKCADSIRTAVSYLGAGIYEELLFRLILLTSILQIVLLYGVSKAKSMAIAVIVTSLLFAAAHHIGACGEPFQWFAFTFRTTAGVFFSLIFIYRGFGIAAGSHAAYDILVGILGILLAR